MTLVKILHYILIKDIKKNFKEICFDFQSIFDRKRVLTLIECLWDTYTNNKILALDLLVKIDRKTYDNNVNLTLKFHLIKSNPIQNNKKFTDYVLVRKIKHSSRNFEK